MLETSFRMTHLLYISVLIHSALLPKQSPLWNIWNIPEARCWKETAASKFPEDHLTTNGSLVEIVKLTKKGYFNRASLWSKLQTEPKLFIQNDVSKSL